ncbi:MAG: diguanylate cyclase, partial [Planctomycetales bacterium]|nr:diguanylate cyclase [Planctomycetales bacterium]
RGPATGALEDPDLVSRVARSVALCRRRRAPLSLMLVEIDEFDDLVMQYGLAAAEAAHARIMALAGAVAQPAPQTIAVGDGRFAALLEETERSVAVTAARNLLLVADEALARLSPPMTAALSVGIACVALPAKNFPPADLVEAAQRCVFGVTAMGGGGVKSIDIW